MEVLSNQDPFMQRMEAPRTPRMMARMRGAASSDSGFASSSMGDNAQPGLAGGGGGGLQVRCNYRVVQIDK